MKAIFTLGFAALAAATQDIDVDKFGPPHGPPTLTGKPSMTWGGPPGPGLWTTSTVYSTKIRTVISCPPAIPSCPAHSTRVTTVIVPIKTTVCPVTTTPTVKPPHPSSAKPPHLSSAKPPAPPSSVKPPPTTLHPTKAIPTPTRSVGSLTPPTSTRPPGVVVTAGAAQNAKVAGGVLAAVAAAAALF